MYLSCCIWALTGPESGNLQKMATLGFKQIDIQPHMLRSDGHVNQANELGLNVSSVAASFSMPSGAALDSPDKGALEQALVHTESALAHAASFGATVAYVVPGTDDSPETLARYADALVKAANKGEELGVKLCIEHFPGKALPTASRTLQFIRDIGHPNLYLLFDIGHIQMAGEDPAATIIDAGPLLGYVHLDDNDGKGDLHWSLLDGVLTEGSLKGTFEALTEIGYSGAVSLELSPKLPDPYSALKQSREIVLRVGAEYFGHG